MDVWNGEYISSPGNINFWGNIIPGNTNNSVVTHRGWRLQLFEFFEYSNGSFFEDINHSARDYITTGFRLTSRGLMKYLSIMLKNNTVTYIAKHFETSYAYSSYKTKKKRHPLDDTEFSGVTISVFGY